MIHNSDQIKNAVDIVEVIGKEVKLKRNGQNYVGLCPFHTEKSPSFTVSPTKRIFKCFGCGKSGDVIDFVMDNDRVSYPQAVNKLAEWFSIEVDQDPIEYTPPPPRLEKLRPEVISYFESRGISNNTLLRFGVTESKEWMPKGGENTPVICFNYFRDGELVNIKYRGKDKDMRLHKGSELILYNIDSLEGAKECVIVEGEIDAMSVYEAGYHNVVSVPNGASKGYLQLKYLDNCYHLFDSIERVIVFTDSDGPGAAIQEEITRRIGKDKCFIVTTPDGCKDANDVLKTKGKQALKDIIYNARPIPIEGVLGMDELYPKIADLYKNGYPKGCKAGLGDFDELLSFTGGQLTVITGAPGSGKSEFFDLIMTKLSINYGWRWMVASFENPAELHATKIMEKYTGLAFDYRSNPYNRMNTDQFNDAVIFLDNHFRFINVSDAELDIDNLLLKFKEMVKRFGIKGIMIDPWNYIEHKIPRDYTETQYIGEVLTKIKQFTTRHDVHILLVAHPKKMQKDPQTKQYPIATMYDIAGSAHFFNKTDNGVSVHRDFNNNNVDVYIQKIRFSWLGRIGHASFSYDTVLRQYKPI